MKNPFTLGQTVTGRVARVNASGGGTIVVRKGTKGLKGVSRVVFTNNEIVK